MNRTNINLRGLQQRAKDRPPKQSKPPKPTRAEQKLAKLQAQCDRFNAECPIGTEVLVKRDMGVNLVTKTRSVAYVLSGHTPVIFVEGITGCYALDRVSKVLISFERRDGKLIPRSSALRGGLPVRLSVAELMALRNAATNGGFLGYRDYTDSTREKLRGLGLIERRDDVVTDKAKLTETIRANREALAIPKPNPGDYKGLQHLREVLYACCERLRATRQSGMFLTELGQQYATMDIAIALPGQRTKANERTASPNPESSPNSNKKES